MKKLLSLSILLFLAKAEFYGPTEIVGGTSGVLDPYGLEIVSNAQQNPNLTRGVAFMPFDVDWTWRVNISDFAAPNAEDELGEVLPTIDPHVITATYDFTWPGSGNISTQLKSGYIGLCLTFMASPIDLPVNVTNAYTEDDTNDASCVPVLGQACVDAILSDGRISRGSAVGSCTSPSRYWFEIPECQSTLGYAQAVGGSPGTFTTSIGVGNDSSNATNSWKNGEGWYASFSAPRNGSGSTAYYTTANQLNMVKVNPILSSQVVSAPTTESGGHIPGPELLCMRVNATKLPTGDTNGDGVTWTSEAVMEMENIGSFIKPSAICVMFVVSFISLTLAFTT